jgi:2-methylcitrate dehydratase PrpD
MNDMAVPVLTTASSRLVEFLSSRTLDNLPQDTIRNAKLRLLDTLGCGLYGAYTPWGEMLSEVVREEQSRGGATLYGSRDPVSPARAALVNGTGTHGFELDDGAPGQAHPGAVVVPSALATSEHHKLPGQRLLLGMIAGYETTSRVGLAIGETGWGFHKTGIAGVVGSAVASGIALGLTHEQILRAIGIACSSAAGIKSFIQGSGGMVKRMHAGRASESGVLACLLARKGFTAPLAALDGKFGLLETYCSETPKPEILQDGLGESFVVDRVKVKAYSFCYDLHTTAQAVEELRREHAIDHRAVKRLRVGTNERHVALHADNEPKETMAAQYSTPYVCAVAMIKDAQDPRQFRDEVLDDAEVCALSHKVELYAHPEMQVHYPLRNTAHVTIEVNDGRLFEKTVLEAKGTPANPCSEAEIRAKFRRLASAALPESAVNEVSVLVDRIDTLPSLEPLSRALRAVR